MDKLERQKAYMRNYMAEYREKQTALAACKVNCKTNSKVNSKTNVNEADKELDKEIEEENNHCASQPSPAAVNAFFESVWALYPIKRGKGQVSKSKREALPLPLDRIRMGDRKPALWCIYPARSPCQRSRRKGAAQQPPTGEGL